MAGGRPSGYTKAIANQICNRLIDGESLRAICRSASMPDKATVFRWLDDERHKEFRDQYAQARERQTESFIDELLDIADNLEEDVQRSKLRIDTRKWIASKIMPSKYGKPEADNSSSDQIDGYEVVNYDD